ncbi:MAG: pyridoxal phosphate-dependent aminotransferase [Acidobacteria bacterium]|nr:MAG: pyridoxal phosphate-dependent aminotransferase [Acidobacteriota bacterium]
MSRYQFSVIRERLRERGDDALDFAIGSAGVPLAEPLAEIVREQPQLALSRATPDELEAFAAGAAEMLFRVFGVRVDTDLVLAVPGSRVAMSTLTACLLRPDDNVLVTEPGYPAFARVAAHQHVRIWRASLDPERDFLPDLDLLAKSGPIRIAALNYPNNPTGAVLTSSGVAELAARVGPEAILFNDSAYGPLVYEGSPPSLLGIGALEGLEQPMAELHSLSKLFSLGPLGISYFVGTSDLIGELREYSDFAWAPLSSLHLQLARHCVVDEPLLDSVRSFFAKRIEALRATIVDLGFRPYPTPAGMYVLCSLPRSIAGTAVTGAQQAADILLDQFGLAVAAWEVAPHAYLRFSSLYREEDLESLAKLGERLEIVS